MLPGPVAVEGFDPGGLIFGVVCDPVILEIYRRMTWIATMRSEDDIAGARRVRDSVHAGQA